MTEISFTCSRTARRQESVPATEEKKHGLMRYYSKYQARETAYYDPATGQLFSEKSKVHKLGEQASLAAVLAACDCSVLYLMPAADGSYPAVEEYYSIPGLDVTKYLSRRKSATVKFQNKTINVYPIKTWADVSPGTSLKAMITGKRALQKEVEDLFQPQKVTSGREERFPMPLLATPAQMSAELLKFSLPYNQVYEPLPEEEAMTIIINLGQGRIETFYHGNGSLERIYDYDGRWMYAACLRHVPNGKMVHDFESVFEKYTPGFYRVNATVPTSWNHIGLLPMRNPSGSNIKFSYPRTPGQTFASWCTTPELRLAVANGWEIEVKERILWPETSKLPEPLKMLGERLIKLRLEIAEKYPEPARSIIRAGARNMLLHLVGSLHRVDREYDGYTSDIASVPRNATSSVLIDGEDEIWRYTLPEKLSPLQRVMSQPHWPAYLWGDARARGAKQALLVPFEVLVAFRVDAVWTSKDMEWQDDGKIGTFRREVLQDDTDLQWPRNNADMVKIVQRVKGKK